jgi:hypothetical protein
MVMLQTKVRQDALTRARWRADWPGRDKDADFTSLHSSAILLSDMLCSAADNLPRLHFFSSLPLVHDGPVCLRLSRLTSLWMHFAAVASSAKGVEVPATPTQSEPVYML